MKARLLTAAIGLPFVIFVLIFCESFPWILNIVISVLSAIMTFEMLSAKKLQKVLSISIPTIVFSIIEPFLITTDFKILPIFVLILILLFVMILKSEILDFNKIAFTLVGVLFVVLGMSSILFLSHILNGYISFSFVLPVAIAWIADAGAYFTGVFFGKHKLCPKISPKKTVEGFIGGVITGTLSSMLIGFIFSLIYNNVSFNYLTLIFIGLLGALVSVLGDLTFSQIKRSCNIKDYGSLFPGHGGMLDRFDSVIFVSPLICFVSLYFPIIIV